MLLFHLAVILLWLGLAPFSDRKKGFRASEEPARRELGLAPFSDRKKGFAPVRNLRVGSGRPLVRLPILAA
jgi:hypothetical protein